MTKSSSRRHVKLATVDSGIKLQQTGAQPLELAFGHRVEVNATNALLGTRTLQPPEENLCDTGSETASSRKPRSIPVSEEAPVYGALLGIALAHHTG